MDVFDFLEDADVFDKIIKYKGEISLIDAMKGVTGHPRTEDEIRPYWEKTIAATKNAFRLLNEHFSELPKKFEDLDFFLRDLGLKLSPHESKIYQRVYFILLSEYEKKHNLVLSIRDLVDTGFILPNYPSEDKLNRYRLLQRDIESLEQDKSALNTQVSDLKSQLRNFGKPQGVTFGIVILAYFSLVGIVVPLFLLPSTTDQFTSIHKWIIFGLFVSALLLFFFYLFTLVRQLTKQSNSDPSA
jgi:cell division protein FtsL